MEQKILQAYAKAMQISENALSLEWIKPAGFRIFYHSQGNKMMVFKQVANPGNNKFEFCKYPCEELHNKMVDLFFMAVQQERNIKIFKQLFERALIKHAS